MYTLVAWLLLIPPSFAVSVVVPLLALTRHQFVPRLCRSSSTNHYRMYRYTWFDCNRTGSSTMTVAHSSIDSDRLVRGDVSVAPKWKAPNGNRDENHERSPGTERAHVTSSRQPFACDATDRDARNRARLSHECARVELPTDATRRLDECRERRNIGDHDRVCDPVVASIPWMILHLSVVRSTARRRVDRRYSWHHNWMEHQPTTMTITGRTYSNHDDQSTTNEWTLQRDEIWRWQQRVSEKKCALRFEDGWIDGWVRIEDGRRPPSLSPPHSLVFLFFVLTLVSCRLV